MQKYRARVFWYIALLLITVGVLTLPFPVVGKALISALGVYIPLSILCIAVNYVVIKNYGLPQRTFGIDTEMVGWYVMLIGAIIAGIYFIADREFLLFFGITTVFAGFDWILSAREGKSVMRMTS